MSYLTFAAIKATIGLRVTEEDEDAGLDIVEHGMYGYPEQFIPRTEIGAASSGPKAKAVPAGVTATAATATPAAPGEVSA